MSSYWQDYDSGNFFDELVTPSGQPRKVAKQLTSYLKDLSLEELALRQKTAEAVIADMGISFTVYTEEGNIDRAWPFDILPRIISVHQWEKTAAGLAQRLQALNLFINDIYNDQNILKDEIVPRYLIEQSSNYRKECRGITPPYGVWANICGTDLVRDSDGEFYVLEDNLRVPSGVSYMLENRAITKRVLPELFESDQIQPVNQYPQKLFETLKALAPERDEPEIVVLTPGIYNSAYFEHAFLAQQMGVELVQGSDLVVRRDGYVYMRTIDGYSRVDVIYRRIDDAFLDPKMFNKDSLLGVPGLMKSWQQGKVALANAPGAGVADDKVIYAYVPAIIRYYLKQEPLINNVETFLCSDPEHREYVLDNLHQLVVKPANESGGYGMLIGPHSTKKQQNEFAELIKQKPRNYIAQPTLKLSTAPALINGKQLEPRHLDLRPFILQAKNTYVTPGGLTRVAMKKGSLVVNSSQGGGSKDTWIVDTEVS